MLKIVTSISSVLVSAVVHGYDVYGSVNLEMLGIVDSTSSALVSAEVHECSVI